ncbi:hypothetical protein AA0242T_2393 [Acetobacter aceti NRIC 0242]|uniref:Flagellar assembly protein FliH/Type III secretion system HrpE domain-containing protein n=1 Tax=Acetobacter aceti NBRC 14818 TaxID=887700 RepID=A0AB33IHP5_ACEAC|nr:hypothetical protein [Acetobacter aceti]TCS32031.1 hypothetical protein EDC15_11365 [Acetobacter aceti NBRC 14818]BCK77336.1 hypothetical protein EMQ_2942 [Acetobacter aceti NBRC 14818]GAN58977.1 hypothetical protein Abac_217_009 [Acetobacter aceti NBRC 14818]GBO81691.1 hypothetical protein AA0242T_2393 [Acetobacter aceti NRIC 0242]
MNTCIVLSGENKSGVLFAEDFDDISNNIQKSSDHNEDPVPEEPAAPPVPSYSQEEMDSAIAVSVLKATERVRDEMEKTHLEEIEKIKEENKNKFQNIFDSINKNIDLSLYNYSENLSRSILVAVVSSFPAWSDSQKKLWAEGILDKILSYFSDDFTVYVKTHPDCCEEVKKTLFENKNVKDDRIKFLEDSNLHKTDFEIEYSDGKISRHIELIVSNILTDLSNSINLNVKGDVSNG